MKRSASSASATRADVDRCAGSTTSTGAPLRRRALSSRSILSSASHWPPLGRPSVLPPAGDDPGACEVSSSGPLSRARRSAATASSTAPAGPSRAARRPRWSSVGQSTLTSSAVRGFCGVGSTGGRSTQGPGAITRGELRASSRKREVIRGVLAVPHTCAVRRRSRRARVTATYASRRSSTIPCSATASRKRWNSSATSSQPAGPPRRSGAGHRRRRAGRTAGWRAR